jgi:hypothetical protein
MLSVIGIHAKMDDHGKVSPFTGHAWLSIHFTNGRQDSVGLWPEQEDISGVLLSARLFVRDPVGVTKSSEEKLRVSWGIEIRGHYRPYASRYYGLRQGEQNKAISNIGKFTGWRLEYNCTSWATDKIREIFGVALPHSEFAGTHDSPRSLAATLVRLEPVRPTAINNPYYP